VATAGGHGWMKPISYLAQPGASHPSAAADRRIRRRIFVRRKSAGKITARRISRRILLAVNPPQKMSPPPNFYRPLALYEYLLLIFVLECMFSTTGLVANSKRFSLSAEKLHRIILNLFNVETFTSFLVKN